MDAPKPPSFRCLLPPAYLLLVFVVALLISPLEFAPLVRALLAIIMIFPLVLRLVPLGAIQDAVQRSPTAGMRLLGEIFALTSWSLVSAAAVEEEKR